MGFGGFARGLRGATPRGKPRGKDWSEDDRRYNRVFARRWAKVEHAIGRLRRSLALTAVNRQGRTGHESRVRAAARLADRIIDHRQAV